VSGRGEREKREEERKRGRKEERKRFEKSDPDFLKGERARSEQCSHILSSASQAVRERVDGSERR